MKNGQVNGGEKEAKKEKEKGIVSFSHLLSLLNKLNTESISIVPNGINW
jgi:hypothetical protein